MYDNETNQAQILRVMIKEARPLRPFEIVEKTDMNKTTIHNNLKQMLDKGAILMKKVIGDDNRSYKYYYPQKFYRDPDLMLLIGEVLAPFIKAIHKNTNYDQMCNNDCKTAIKDNIKLILRLFEIDIDELNSIKRNSSFNRSKANIDLI
ncbi:hypothetical protein LCGC14_0949970 [marine sediment metagenome]|uniref:Uncharacterized protein n=1 Tax=marine sediment metagenome TaxID=412755 RepID=A0A0F9NHK1_9ZZZZ